MKMLDLLLSRGDASVTIENVPRIPEGRWLDRGVLIRKLPYEGLQFGLFSGKDAHQVVCARAAIWLENRGLNWHGGNCLHYPGGIADVLSFDKLIAVEAGYTQSKKVLDALCAKVSVLVVPYPDEGGWMIEAPLKGYFFEPKNMPTSLELYLEQRDAKVSDGLAELYEKGKP
jgi:hypothetical protein